MVLERARAKELKQASPIHDCIEETHACFDQAVRTILQREAVVEGRSDANLLVASHNQNSIEKAIEAMSQSGLSSGESGVSFGQLLGMSDHISYTLGRGGYKAYKYVPYGPLSEVLPYLIRRAQENSDLLGGVAQQRSMLLEELRSRAAGVIWK